MEVPGEGRRADTLASSATVAIVTALDIEQAAAEAMLDDPAPYSTPGNAPGEYWVGTIPSRDGSYHVVVLGRCMVGENLAAANVTILLERFPQIQTVIMVGIAGAVPDPTKEEADVRLGDIVVCNGNGVVQYDHDKEVLKDGVVTVEQRHPPRAPSARLWAAAAQLTAGALSGRRPWEAQFSRAKKLLWTRRPNEPDVLHSAEHPSVVVERKQDPNRIAGMPKVFSGPIASGNKLLKNAKLRERLRASFGVKAVEMEASGVADASWLQRVGYFVVRGTCDYCDEHKNDKWRGYAAMIAAAYTRALLEETRAAPTTRQGGVASGQTGNAESLSILSRQLRSQVDAAATTQGDGGAALLSALGDLIEAVSDSFDTVDTAWPSGRPWPVAVAEALNATVDSMRVELLPGERMLCVAVPFFVSAVLTAAIKNQFGPDCDSETSDRAYRQLVAASPAVERLLEQELPEASNRLIYRWGILRLVGEQRRRWADSTFRTSSPDVLLARWLAADPFVPTVARVVAGNLEQFEHLPEHGTFRFGDQTLNVRWRLLACLLSLAELRVLGVRLLTSEVIEHVSQLPDVWKAIESQFRDLVVESDEDGTWILRATCDEPVLDYAITEIARCLDTDLRSERARMSNYLAQLVNREFPTVRSDPVPRLVNGNPRYTTPHVSFSLAPDHARRLFMGTDLWGDLSFAYRELFQNALDACRYRLARSRYLNIPYSPSIRIFHGRTSEGREYVECEDNGVGMDRDLVASCFATGGRRFVTTEEFRREKETWREKGIEIHTNSHFGIGVFSYFLVADELEVETARLGRSGESPRGRLSLRVPTSAAFFRIVYLSDEEARVQRQRRAAERGDEASAFLDAGTRVRLWLRPPKAEPAEKVTQGAETCVDAIRKHVWFSEVAVDVKDYRGHAYQLIANELAPWLPSTVEACGLEPRFWWLLDPLPDRQDLPQGPEPITTFRSRKRSTGDREDDYRGPGRVLVDGIATDHVTPGFIVNLRGAKTPKLALDRRKIRSDIRALMEERVNSALNFLPDPVPEQLLDDLWRWDPRACHNATCILRTKKRFWVRKAPTRGFWQQGEPSEQVEQTYFPPVAKKTHYTDNYREKLLALWRIARRSPDSREQSPAVLETRGIESEFRNHLMHIPRSIWNALSEVDLGVPEACALAYGYSGKNPLAIPAYMSWLTGETIHNCTSRMEKLRGLLDLDWSQQEYSPGCVISDYDAWLLGHGSFSTSWVGPEITTLDAILFTRNSGKTVEDSLRDFREIAGRLGLTFAVDADLVRAAIPLTQDEITFVYFLRDGWLEFGTPPGLTLERASLLAAIAGVDIEVTRKFTQFPQVAKDENQRVLFRALSRTVRMEGGLDLAGLCEVARSLERSIPVTAEDIAKSVTDLAVKCEWDKEGVHSVTAFSELDWEIAEEVPNLWSSTKRVRPRSKAKLAAFVARNSYKFSGAEKTAARILRRIEGVYDVFGWGPVPLSEADVQIALDLKYEEASLLHDMPTERGVTIPWLLVRAATSTVTLPQLSAALNKIAALEFQAPDAQDSYLGTTWAEALRECEEH